VNSKLTNRNLFNIISVALIGLATFLLVCFFLHGQTTITGSWITDRKMENMVCVANEVKYPFFDYDNSKRTSIKINVIFQGDVPIFISLTYLQYHNTEKESTDSENLNHVAMNSAFSQDGLGFDALNLKFSKFSNGLQMSLYTESDGINVVSKKYFLLENIANNQFTMDEMRSIYATQGLDCKSNNEEQYEN